MGKICQIVVADGFAGGQLPVAKNQKRLAFFDPIELARERFEKSSGSHDGIRQPRFDQGFFKGQLGMLKRQQGFLYADGRQLHKVPHTRSLRRLQRPHMGLMIDPPSILG
jgi:hypothetical protein